MMMKKGKIKFLVRRKQNMVGTVKLDCHGYPIIDENGNNILRDIND